MQRVNEILASLETQSKFDLGHEETGIDGCETIIPETRKTPLPQPNCVPFFEAAGTRTLSMEEQ